MVENGLGSFGHIQRMVHNRSILLTCCTVVVTVVPVFVLEEILATLMVLTLAADFPFTVPK